MRRRVNPRKRTGRTVASSRPSTAKPVPLVEDSTISILAIPDLLQGRLSVHDAELLAAARELADGYSSGVLVLALGGQDDFASHGVDRVVSLSDPVFNTYAPEVRADVVCRMVDQFDLKHILFCESLDGGDLGRRVAARLGERPAAQVFKFSEEFSATEVHCSGRGGLSEFILPAPRVLFICAGSFHFLCDVRHEARELEPVDYDAAAKLECDGVLSIDLDDMVLEECAFVIGAGNGVSDWVSLHEVAAVLNGAVGGSRVACDSGNIERHRQIGASGCKLLARCYLAFGISGAIQHMQGIEECEQVVSVNIDPYCPLVKRSDLAVIADAEAVIKSILRQVAVSNVGR